MRSLPQSGRLATEDGGGEAGGGGGGVEGRGSMRGGSVEEEAEEAMTCKECTFFRAYEVPREEDEGDGKCCYDPPAVIAWPDGQYFRTAFPDVLYEQWCGKWQRREGEMRTMMTEKAKGADEEASEECTEEGTAADPS